MRKRIFVSSSGKWVLLFAGVAIGVIGTRKAAGEITTDGVPAGMVAYISGGACPSGWTPATNIEGRIVIAVADGKDLGVQVGTPLTDREDRNHSHSYSGELPLPPKSISAADGPNLEGAQAQTYTVSGTTNAGPSGLPFVQVTTCVKQ
ncbi:MAG TPA: hypothetical protein PK156_09150 [Polyangium sp.]|nr:hypothetical protein [Polyangium sp.]